MFILTAALQWHTMQCMSVMSMQQRGSAALVGMQVGGTEAALFDYARGGPQWGADALVIGPPRVSQCVSCPCFL